MPSNAFFRATRKVVGMPKRFEPATTPVSVNVQTMGYDPNIKSQSLLAKVSIQFFREKKARIKANETKKTDKKDSANHVAETALVVHPTASNASRAAKVDISKVVILDWTNPLPPVNDNHNNWLAKSQDVYTALTINPVLSGFELRLLHIVDNYFQAIKDLSAKNTSLRVDNSTKQEKLADTEELVQQLKVEVDDLEEQYYFQREAAENLQDANAKLEGQNTKLEGKHTTLKTNHCNLKAKHKALVASKDNIKAAYYKKENQCAALYAEKKKLVDSEATARKSYNDLFGKCRDFYYIHANYKAAYERVNHNCFEWQQYAEQQKQAATNSESAAEIANAAATKSAAGYTREQAAHKVTKKELAESQQCNAGLVENTQRIFEEREMDAEAHEEAMKAKDDQIARLEKELAELRADEAASSNIHQRNVSDSTTLSTEDSGILFSSATTSPEPQAQSSPSSLPVGLLAEMTVRYSAMKVSGFRRRAVGNLVSDFHMSMAEKAKTVVEDESVEDNTDQGDSNATEKRSRDEDDESNEDDDSNENGELNETDETDEELEDDDDDDGISEFSTEFEIQDNLPEVTAEEANEEYAAPTIDAVPADNSNSTSITPESVFLRDEDSIPVVNFISTNPDTDAPNPFADPATDKKHTETAFAGSIFSFDAAPTQPAATKATKKKPSAGPTKKPTKPAVVASSSSFVFGITSPATFGASPQESTTSAPEQASPLSSSSAPSPLPSTAAPSQGSTTTITLETDATAVPWQYVLRQADMGANAVDIFFAAPEEEEEEEEEEEVLRHYALTQADLGAHATESPFA